MLKCPVAPPVAMSDEHIDDSVSSYGVFPVFCEGERKLIYLLLTPDLTEAWHRPVEVEQNG